MTILEKVTSTAFQIENASDSASLIQSQHELVLPPRWPLLALGAFMILGGVGNALVCVAIFTEKRLQNVTNYFLFSLAIADLLVSMLVMPISILIEIHHGYWPYGFLFCAGHTYVDVFLCSASIVHMSIISVDRYLGISQPLKTRNKSKLVVILKIIAVWIITTMISCPIIVLAVVKPDDIYKDHICNMDNPYFMIYGSTLAFLIPSLIMAATYIRTTQLLRQEAITCSNAIGTSSRNSRGSTRATNSGDGLRRTHVRHRRSANTHERQRTIDSNDENIPGSRNGFNSPILPINDIRYSTNINNRTQIYKYQVNANEPSLPITVPVSTPFVGNGQRDRSLVPNRVPSGESQASSTISSLQIDESTISTTTGSFRSKLKERTMTFWNKTARRGTSASELANEQKATRVLGLVFGCFFVCWTPFFVHNFTLAFCGNSCHIPRWMASVFLWLGYISSTINPIIYTVFSEKFRRAFLKILTCRLRLTPTPQNQLTRVSGGSSFQTPTTAGNYPSGSYNYVTNSMEKSLL